MSYGMTRRAFVLDAARTVAGGATALALASCAPRNEANDYFRGVYRGIAPDSLTEDEMELVGRPDFWEISPHEKGFVQERFPYVDAENPSERDVAFLKRYKTQIELLGMHSDMQKRKITPAEQRYINEWRRENPSGRVADDGTELSRYLLTLVNEKKMSDRDIVFVHEAADAFSFNVHTQ